MNQIIEDIDAKENNLKTALWKIGDKRNEAETEDLNVETMIDIFLVSFNRDTICIYKTGGKTK